MRSACPPVCLIDAGDNTRVIRLRVGDAAIITGATLIAAYERLVRDDDDLISHRVSAYRSTPWGRLITDTIILATALHLAESYTRPEYDVYHHLMRWVRRKVTPET